MPKFLFEAMYTQDGVTGVQSAGGSSRRDAVAQLAESVVLLTPEEVDAAAQRSVDYRPPSA